ncbi:hypothetical protein [Methylophaga sp.]
MTRIKKISVVITTLSLLLLGGFTAHKVYAGKPFISLNAPVSFPVDI